MGNYNSSHPKWMAQSLAPCLGSCISLLRYVGQITKNNGFLLRGHRLVILMVLQENYLQDLHENYTGIAKSKVEAHNTIYWPDIESDTDKFICTLQSMHPIQTIPVPLISHKVPQGP